MIRIKRNIKTYFIIQRHISINCDLVGRKILRPGQITSEEIKSIIWTALDLRNIFTKNQLKINILNDVKATLLLSDFDYRIQCLIHNVSHLLGLKLNIITDPTWEEFEHYNDVGRIISTHSDILLVESKSQRKLEALAEGATIPILNCLSCKFAIPQVINDLVILQQKFGYLTDLNIGWIGLPCPIFNTFLCILPRLGLNIRYVNAPNKEEAVSPSQLPIGKAYSEYMQTRLTQYNDVKEMLKETDVIMTSYHTEERIKITLDNIEKCCREWKFLHNLPRGKEVEGKVLHHEKSIVWEALENRKYTYSAIILRLLRKYNHLSPYPNFDKLNVDKTNIDKPNTENPKT